jgi:hypothetical protein
MKNPNSIFVEIMPAPADIMEADWNAAAQPHTKAAAGMRTPPSTDVEASIAAAHHKTQLKKPTAAVPPEYHSGNPASAAVPPAEAKAEAAAPQRKLNEIQPSAPAPGLTSLCEDLRLMRFTAPPPRS